MDDKRENLGAAAGRVFDAKLRNEIKEVKYVLLANVRVQCCFSSTLRNALLLLTLLLFNIIYSHVKQSEKAKGQDNFNFNTVWLEDFIPLSTCATIHKERWMWKLLCTQSKTHTSISNQYTEELKLEHTRRQIYTTFICYFSFLPFHIHRFVCIVSFWAERAVGWSGKTGELMNVVEDEDG